MASSGLYSSSSTKVKDNINLEKLLINCKAEDDDKQMDKPKANAVKPKSPKVLVRKNTPAELPTVAKIYAKDRMKKSSPLVEEEATEVKGPTAMKPVEASDLATSTSESSAICSPKNLSGVHIIISEDNGKT